MDKIKLLFGLLLFILAPISQGESIYKWVDEHGVTHYSAANPNDKKAQQLKTQPPPPAAESGGAQPSLKNWQANESLKNFKEKRAREEAADTQQRAERDKRCTIAKQRLGVLQQQIRLYRTNNKGEKEYWEEDERNAETKRVQEEVNNNC
jgi:hypothetical protein